MKIGIFRALKLGDILCSSPAFYLLRSNFPFAEIYFIGLPETKELLARYGCLSGYISFPGWDGLPERKSTSKERSAFITIIRQMKFDLLFQMQGDGTAINEILSLCEPRELITFYPQSDPPSDMSYTQIYPTDLHEIDRNLKLLEQIGIYATDSDRTIHFPLFKEDWQRFTLLRKNYGIYDFVIIHVGSSDPTRQWPLENFALVGNYLMDTHHSQLVLTGTKGEGSKTKKMNELLRGFPIDLAGQTDLGTIGCLLKECKLLISNCTGISHLAAGIGTKSIVISMDGEPERWAPLNHNLHHTFDATKPLDIQRVLKAADQLLSVDLL